MKSNRKLLFFIVIIVFLSLVCILFMLLTTDSENKKASIYLNNELYRTVNLSDLSIDDEFIIETEYGFNRIKVRNGMICVSEDDCPDKTCVKTGWTNSFSRPVICIPHRLEIVVDDISEIDGVSG